MIDLSQVTDIMLGNETVTQIEDSLGNVLWSATPAVEYFYVEDISGSDNTLSIVKEASSIPTTEIFKSTDQTNWTSMGTTDTTAITATVPANGKLYLKSVTNRLGNGTYSGTKISCTGNYNVGGYLTSLIFGDDFETNTLTGKSEQTFYNLFRNSVNLISAGKLIMPTTSQRRCYGGMFRGCSALTTAPSLSQTAVGKACFSEMFVGCTSLTTAPTLPATTLETDCYSGMFQGCTALTTAPALPATTLANYCYNSMFQGCTALTTAPALPATTLAERCYTNMFGGCTSLTTAPTLPATTLAGGCYYAMFAGCHSLTTAPATLPATTLISWCYYQMFMDCSSLTTAPVLPATVLTAYGYEQMFQSCTSLNKVTVYLDDNSANGLWHWLDNVAATGDFYNLGSATYTTGSGDGIPTGWIEHTTPTIGDNEIKYTSTNNQQINNFTTTGLTILSHTFSDGVGSILLDPTTLSLPEYFADNTTLDTIEFGANIQLNNERILASTNVTTVLSNVTLPANLTTVGARLTRNRQGITTLDIPAGVTSIGTFIAWSVSDNLQYVICRPTTPPTIDIKTFVVKEPSNLISNNFVPVVYVPANSVTAYQTASVWSDYVTAGMQILPIQ